MPRKKKDPDMPKRPLSSYMFYSKERRPKLQEEKPNLQFGEYSKLIAEEWKTMENEKKQQYLDLSKKDKERYEEALKVYKEKKKNEPPPQIPEMEQRMHKNFTTQDNINHHQTMQMRQQLQHRAQQRHYMQGDYKYPAQFSHPYMSGINGMNNMGNVGMPAHLRNQQSHMFQRIGPNMNAPGGQQLTPYQQMNLMQQAHAQHDFHNSRFNQMGTAAAYNNYYQSGPYQYQNSAAASGLPGGYDQGYHRISSDAQKGRPGQPGQQPNDPNAAYATQNSAQAQGYANKLANQNAAAVARAQNAARSGGGAGAAAAGGPVQAGMNYPGQAGGQVGQGNPYGSAPFYGNPAVGGMNSAAAQGAIPPGQAEAHGFDRSRMMYNQQGFASQENSTEKNAEKKQQGQESEHNTMHPNHGDVHFNANNPAMGDHKYGHHSEQYGHLVQYGENAGQMQGNQPPNPNQQGLQNDNQGQNAGNTNQGADANDAPIQPWKNWQPVEKGNYGLVYICEGTLKGNYGYYRQDDDQEHKAVVEVKNSGENLSVNFSELRKPPPEAENVM